MSRGATSQEETGCAARKSRQEVNRVGKISQIARKARSYGKTVGLKGGDRTMDSGSFKAMKLVTAALLLLAPALVFAEPGVSTKHIPFLWGFAAVLGILVALLPFALARGGLFFQTKAMRWVWSIALFLLYMVFGAPFIVVIGSIMITGRTM
jgi:hypothetical protein